jgi:hypothetical protein
MSKPRKTFHDGATKERMAWMTHLRKKVDSISNVGDKNVAVRQFIYFLLDWGAARKIRYKAKKGGL